MSGAGAVTRAKQMGEASALGRTNNISGGRISEEAEGVAMVFAPPAGAEKALPRLPVMGWRERGVEVRCELHATLSSEHKGPILKTRNAQAVK